MWTLPRVSTDAATASRAPKTRRWRVSSKSSAPESMSYDVIIIGAGPAGSTAAAVLAEKGRRVLVLEKEKFPRYHVGESLMPYCWFTLNRLGLVEQMDRIAYVKKYSVQFVTPDGRQSGVTNCT